MSIFYLFSITEEGGQIYLKLRYRDLKKGLNCYEQYSYF